MNTRRNHEYDTFNPDQVISVPSDRNADGSIDIIMSNSEGKVIRRTESDDRVAWRGRSTLMPAGRLFPWEDLPRDASKRTVMEFVARIAQEKNLSLVDLTVFPMSLDHSSLTDRSTVSHAWSLYLDKLKDDKEEPISPTCLKFCYGLLGEYTNNGASDVVPDTDCFHTSKRRRIDTPSLVPKSVFIESSINNSSDHIPSFNDSSVEAAEFGERVHGSDGEVTADLKSVFEGAFPNVKIKTVSRTVIGHKKRHIKFWQASATRIHKGEKIDMFSGYSSTQPSKNVQLDDYSTWYYQKADAITALMWFNLTEESNTQWRKRWFRHLLGGQKQVLLRRTMFDEEEAMVCLLAVRNPKSKNKLQYVIKCP